MVNASGASKVLQDSSATRLAFASDSMTNPEGGRMLDPARLPRHERRRFILGCIKPTRLSIDSGRARESGPPYIFGIRNVLLIIRLSERTNSSDSGCRIPNPIVQAPPPEVFP